MSNNLDPAVDAITPRGSNGTPCHKPEHTSPRETHLRLALDAARMITWQWDIQSGAQWESAPSSFAAFPPGSVRNSFADWFGQVHADDQPRVNEAIRRSVENHEDYAAEYRIPHPDGVVRWIGARGHVIRDSAGRPLRMVGISMDITDRKQAEEALRDSEARWRSLVENAPDIIAIVDRQYRLQFINRAAGDSGDALGVAWMDLIPPEKRDKVKVELERVWRTGAASQFDLEVLRRDTGEPICFSCHVGPVWSRGEITDLVAIARDATEQKRIAEAHSASEERYRYLVEHSPDCIFVSDEDRVLYVNPAGVKLFGVSNAAELIGRSYFEFVPPHRRAAARGRLEEMIRLRKPRSPSIGRLLRPDGQVIPIEVITLPCEYDGHPAYQWILRDVTERWRLEENIRQRLDEMAHVSRVTMMGELVSELAHEVNQPLYAVSNFAEASLNTYRRKGLECCPELNEWLQQIVCQTRRAAEIIQRIGRFVRRSPTHMAAVDINDLVHDVIALFQLDSRADDVSLELQLADSLPRLQLDRVQIEQVLVNLLRNALDAVTESQSVRRAIRICSHLAPDGRVEVGVSDNGLGLPEEEMAKLFEPFFTTKPGGMGMGLTISRSIIEAHGGQLDAERNAEGGMTFRFRLPTAD